MKKKKAISIVCALLILAGGLYYLFAGTDDVNTDSQAAPAQPANLTFAGSSIIEEQDGKRLWELGPTRLRQILPVK